MSFVEETRAVSSRCAALTGARVPKQAEDPFASRKRPPADTYASETLNRSRTHRVSAPATPVTPATGYLQSICTSSRSAAKVRNPPTVTPSCINARRPVPARGCRYRHSPGQNLCLGSVKSVRPPACLRGTDRWPCHRRPPACAARPGCKFQRYPNGSSRSIRTVIPGTSERCFQRHPNGSSRTIRPLVRLCFRTGVSGSGGGLATRAAGQCPGGSPSSVPAHCLPSTKVEEGDDR